MSNILEEYLVKIGATADLGSFRRAQDAIKGLTGSLEKLGWVLKAGGLVGAFAGVTKAIKDQITAVADLDMEYTKLASTMWTTKESGKALAELPKLMKAKPEDIAWIPELSQQFMRLRAEMNAFATPADAADQLKWIREIGYEVQSLQLKFMLFREWVVYYLIKYLGPYIEKIQEFFQDLNENLGENMSKWANNVAYAIAKIVDVMAAVYRLGKNIYEVADRFFTALPEKVKALVPLFTVVGAALMASPFGLFIASIGAAMLLLEDFFCYLDGRGSSTHLAPMWAMLLKIMNGQGLRSFIDLLNEGLQTTFEILEKIVEGLALPDFFDTAIKSIGFMAEGLGEIASALKEIFTQTKTNKGDFLDMFRKMGEIIAFPFRQILRLQVLLGYIFRAAAAAVRGDWDKAGKLLHNGVTTVFSSAGEDVKHMITGQGDMGGFGTLQGAIGSSKDRNDTINRAASMVANPTSDLLGNPNGCTYFVQQALGPDNDFMDGSGLWTPNWYEKAKQQGRWHSGLDGIQKGDVIVWDWGDDGSGEFGDHVGIYDGQGGCYANSTGEQKPVHYDSIFDVGSPAGYIDVGGTFKSPYAAPASTTPQVSSQTQEDVTSNPAIAIQQMSDEQEEDSGPGVWESFKDGVSTLKQRYFGAGDSYATQGTGMAYNPTIGGGWGGALGNTTNDNSSSVVVNGNVIVQGVQDPRAFGNAMTTRTWRASAPEVGTV